MLPTRLEVDAVSDTSNQMKKTKAKFPSGLVSNWQSKVSPLSSSSSKAKTPEPTAPNALTSGGLNDEDAFATFSPEPLVGTVRTRKNDVRC